MSWEDYQPPKRKKKRYKSYKKGFERSKYTKLKTSKSLKPSSKPAKRKK